MSRAANIIVKSEWPIRFLHIYLNFLSQSFHHRRIGNVGIQTKFSSLPPNFPITEIFITTPEVVIWQRPVPPVTIITSKWRLSGGDICFSDPFENRFENSTCPMPRGTYTVDYTDGFGTYCDGAGSVEVTVTTKDISIANCGTVSDSYGKSLRQRCHFNERLWNIHPWLYRMLSILTTSGTAGDGNFVEMITFPFQRLPL